jgi:hypothetical protein
MRVHPYSLHPHDLYLVYLLLLLLIPTHILPNYRENPCWKEMKRKNKTTNLRNKCIQPPIKKGRAKRNRLCPLSQNPKHSYLA